MILFLYIFRILPSNTGGVRKKVMMISYLPGTSEIAWQSEDQSGTTKTTQKITIVIIPFIIPTSNLIFLSECFFGQTI